jgi:hypothetical protein
MVQIIPANPKIRHRSFGESLSEGVGRALPIVSEAYDQYQNKQAREAENKSIMENYGINLSGLSPESRKTVLAEELKGKNKLNLLDAQNAVKSQMMTPQQEKNQQELKRLTGALGVIDEMEQIGQGGNLGLGTTFQQAISPQAREDAGKYETLGKSLISYASSIPIRNRAEFDVLAEKLYDPSISDSGRKGILNGMRKIIQNSISAFGIEEDEEEIPKKTSKRPPLSSFMR